MNVNELVEWVAEQIYGGYCELEDRNGWDWREALKIAKAILSHPDLALIDSNQTFKESSYQRVIPLAKALKK